MTKEKKQMHCITERGRERERGKKRAKKRRISMYYS
jgi:hypothetical protein